MTDFLPMTLTPAFEWMPPAPQTPLQLFVLLHGEGEGPEMLLGLAEALHHADFAQAERAGSVIPDSYIVHVRADIVPTESKCNAPDLTICYCFLSRAGPFGR